MLARDQTQQLGAVELAEHVGGGQAQQLGAVERAERVNGGQAQQLGAVGASAAGWMANVV